MANVKRANTSGLTKSGAAIADVPDVPSIGSATATGATTATVTYTAATTGGTGTTFTATSTPGSLTGTGSSPITVSGLTGSTSYTFTVRSSNSTGNSPFSSASNSITTDVATSFESIATVTFASAGSTVTFNSIPQTYKHLQIRHIARTTNASTGGNAQLRLNGDTNNNYSWHRFEAYGNGITSGGAGSQPSFVVAGLMNGANSISNAFGMGVLDIFEYTNTNKMKTMRTLTGYENNGNGSPGNDQGYLNLASGFWFKAGSGVTSDAVTSITIEINGGGNFAANSQFALYGIKG